MEPPPPPPPPPQNSQDDDDNGEVRIALAGVMYFVSFLPSMKTRSFAVARHHGTHHVAGFGRP